MRAIALVPLLIALTPRGPHGPIGDIKRVTRQRVRYRSLAARKPKELRPATESLSVVRIGPSTHHHTHQRFELVASPPWRVGPPKSTRVRNGRVTRQRARYRSLAVAQAKTAAHRH